MERPCQNYNMISWNVRGLNNVAKQEDVKHLISLHKPDLLCIQETKIANVDQMLIRNAFGVCYENNFCYLPADGTSGGIILATKDSSLLIQDSQTTANTITATIIDARTNQQWSVTGVYGPQGDLEKKMFIRELRQLKNTVKPQWLLMGDFNLIYKEQDKNNGRLNRRLMLRFRRAINHLEINEIDLVGRKYTWSNQQETPTLTRIDRMFCTPAWEERYAVPILQPLSSSASDHCPILLSPLVTPYLQPKFRFESFWVNMSGFHELVAEAWNQPLQNIHNPLKTLHIKLSRVAKALKKWSKTLMSQGKMAMVICKEVIAQLEKAQVSRQLVSRERNLLKLLKRRVLGLAAIEKSRARQKSRITWLRKGDANTKFFQIMANVRKKKKFIHTLHNGVQMVTGQQEKHKVIFDHYLQHIGSRVPRTNKLNFEALGWQGKQLDHLEAPFTEDEVRKVIMKYPKEKAPGPDGFIGLFFSSCWNVVKQDFMNAMGQFYDINCQGLDLLNQAYVVLLPKKDNPEKISDYRPISLTHCFAKFTSKLLANRLAPELDNLISVNQTAFIKKRCIQDTFAYVQSALKQLHKKRIPSLFIKLDISKAFDTINWPFLLDIMVHLGFGQRWRNWVSSLWCTASSCFLLNGEPGQ